MKIEQVKNSNEKLNYIQVTDTSISVKVFPNLGASIQEFIYKGNQIIDGVSADESGLNDYKNTYKSAILFPFPNRIKNGSYTFQEVPHQLDINEVGLGNAIHGMVYNKHFEVVRCEVIDQKAIILLNYSNTGDLAGFPFPFDLNISYEIDTNGKIKLIFKAKNTGNEVFPFGMGWHPYFLTSDIKKSELSFDSKEKFIIDEQMIPLNTVESSLEKSIIINDQSFDDAFTIGKYYTVFKNPDYQVDLKFENEIDSYLQIYTPPHRNTVAIEPMTCPPDTFNNKLGLQELEPNKEIEWAIDMEATVE